jgi:hypothetical protein
MEYRERATIHDGRSSGPSPAVVGKIREFAAHVARHPLPCECGRALATVTRTKHDHLFASCHQCTVARLSPNDSRQLRLKRGLR